MAGFDRAAQQARFHELFDEIDAIEDAARPLREARDAFVNEARERERTMNAEIKEAEAGLAEKKEELAFLSRGLGGQTGARPSIVGKNYVPTPES